MVTSTGTAPSTFRTRSICSPSCFARELLRWIVRALRELSPGIAADVDREGRVLGVEIVKTFSTKAKKLKFHGSVDLDEVQKAIEHRFSVKLDREFKEVREAGRAVFAP